MKVADCIELYLANHPMPQAPMNAAFTTQLEQSQESSMDRAGSTAQSAVSAGGPGSGRHPEFGNFKKTFSSNKTTYYTAGKTQKFEADSPRHIVQVNHPKYPSGKTTVTEEDRENPKIGGKPTQVYGTYRNAGASQDNDFHGFMKERYGIES